MRETATGVKKWLLLGTALMHATWDGDYETVQVLVEFGANINMQNIRLNTALHFACDKNYRNIIDFLCSRKAKLLRNGLGQMPNLPKDIAANLYSSGIELPKVELILKIEARTI